uniref:Uncharacterized protein n=1 Tax=Tanacetum cinerariifolium TaxID=118510 RepID=A0A6L2L2W7_TANCI|nr:hypothetical protein [Tanacetum cinerariifolium]
MLEYEAYKTYYAYASREKTPKPKLKFLAKVAKSDKQKQPAVMLKTEVLVLLSEVSLIKAEQIKLATKRSKKDFHMSHVSSSGYGVDTQSKVPDEQQQKVTGTNEGASVRPEVPNVPKYNSKSDEESWTFSQDEDDADEETDVNYYKHKEGDDEDMEGEQEQDKEDDMYRVVNINLERSDAELTNAQSNQDTEDTHVTLTIVPLVVQQQSSSVSSHLFDQRVSALETEMFEFKQTNQFIEVVSSILGIVDNHLTSKMKEEVDVVVQRQTNKLKEEAQAENQEFLNQRGRDDQDKDEDPFDGSNQGSKRRRSGKEAESLTLSTHKESKHKIIVVTSLKIIEWFGYSYREEIIVRRQDDKLYKYREGEFKRLRRQNIEDMLLLLVQDKLPNHKLEERYALNVDLRIFTRRIVIQERMEDP